MPDKSNPDFCGGCPAWNGSYCIAIVSIFRTEAVPDEVKEKTNIQDIPGDCPRREGGDE